MATPQPPSPQVPPSGPGLPKKAADGQAQGGPGQTGADKAREEALEELIYNQDITGRNDDNKGDEQPEHATLAVGESVLIFPEEIPPESFREYSKLLYNSFTQCQRLMSALLRFPIVSAQNDDRTTTFAYNWASIKGALYFLTAVLLGLIAVVSSTSLIATMLNFPKMPKELTTTWAVAADRDHGRTVFQRFMGTNYPQRAVYNYTVTELKNGKLLRAEEMFYFRRNVLPIMIILFLLIHIITSDFNMYRNRHFIASYLTFWVDSVEIMKMDAGVAAQKFFRKLRIYYIFWFSLLCLVLGLNFAPITTGAPTSFAFLWCRTFYPTIHAVEDFYISILRYLGGIVCLYVILASKVYVFFFLYVCKLLSNSCIIWNSRLELIFTAKGKAMGRADKCATRTGYDHIFKDYVNILDLQAGADTLFTNIIESYFSMTIISIVFEVYLLARPLYGPRSEFAEARILDMVIVGSYLFNSIVILYLVSTGAAEVGESSAQGLEIIRKQGILGHRPDAELQLMISLYMSYTGHFDTSIRGGGYFILDKPFFIAVVGTIISFIIIIFQFQPALGLDDNEARIRLQLGTEENNPYHTKYLTMHTEYTLLWSKHMEPYY